MEGNKAIPTALKSSDRFSQVATTPSSGARKAIRKRHPDRIQRRVQDMKTATFRISFVAIGLLGPTLFRMEGGSGPDLDAQFVRAPASGLIAKITLRNGAVRNIRLEGVGCPGAICSRTAILAPR